jgi:hypothetical protein
MDQTIRVSTTLFAATIGFGLKHLLDSTVLGSDQWPLFVTGILFFMKFLIGSANHLQFEYGSQQTCPPLSQLILVATDLLFLVTFGCLAAGMCYADSAAGFLVLGSTILFAAVFWGILDTILRKVTDTPPRGNWRFWIATDLVQLGIFVLALKLENAGLLQSPLIGSWSVLFTAVVILTAAVLLTEIVLILRTVEVIPGGASSTAAGR